MKSTIFDLMSKRVSSRARVGLTLIELVCVMAILAVLAAMVIPRLDFLKNQAEHAASAATQGDLGMMIQTFKASSGKYPTLDTLVGTDQALYSKLQAQTALSALEATTIPPPGAPGTSDWYRSLSDTGFSYGYAHDQASTDASASGTTVVDVVNQIFDGSQKFATLKATGGGSLATALRTAIYPGGVTYVAGNNGPDGVVGGGDDVPGTWTQVAAGTMPATSKLVVFGVGPKSNLVGNVMQSAPLSNAGSDDTATVYCRYLVVFEIFANGNPAKLRMVTDHRLRQIGGRLDQYKSVAAQS